MRLWMRGPIVMARHEQDLVRPRTVAHADLHGVEMAAHIGRVDMAERHVEPRAERADLGRRRHDRLGAAEPVAHRVAAGHMPQRAMLQLACRADDRALAVAVDLLRVAAQRIDELVGQQQPERLQIFHRRLQPLDIAPGERVLHHRHRRRAQPGLVGRRPALVKDFLGDDSDLAHRKFSHAFSHYS